MNSDPKYAPQVIGCTALLVACLGAATVEAKPPRSVKLDLATSGYTPFFGPRNLYFAYSQEGDQAHYVRYDLVGKGKKKLPYTPAVSSGASTKYTNAKAGTVAPDGTSILFRSSAGDDATNLESVWVLDVATQSLRAVLRSVAIDGPPMYFPDGKRVFYALRGSPPARKPRWNSLDLETGAVSTHCDSEHPDELRLAPDGAKVIGLERLDRVFISTLDCGTITSLQPPDGWGEAARSNSGRDNGPTRTAISPASTQVAVVTRRGELWVFDATTGAGKRIADAKAAGILDPAWLDEDTLLVQGNRSEARGGELAVYAVTVSTGAVAGALGKEDSCSELLYASASSAPVPRAIIKRECTVKHKKTGEWHLLFGQPLKPAP